MILKVGSKYILRFEINGVELTYTATILADDGEFITFIDKYNSEKTYNRSKLITAEVIQDES